MTNLNFLPTGKTRNLGRLLAIFMVPAVILTVFVVSLPVSANSDCSDVYGNVNGHIISTGSPATARITNNSDCVYTISLASYKQFSTGSDWITSQQLFDSVTTTLNPHQTIDTNVLRVSVPSCHYQIDLVQGSALTPPNYGVSTGHALFDAQFGGGDLCGSSTPVDNSPIGNFAVDCTAVTGSVYTPSNPSASMSVTVFANGPQYIGSLVASGTTSASTHNFSIAIPASLKDGATHQIWAYANGALFDNYKYVTCVAPTPAPTPVVTPAPTPTPVPTMAPTPRPSYSPRPTVINNTNITNNTINNNSTIVQNGNGNVAQVNQSGVITSVSSAGSSWTPFEFTVAATPAPVALPLSTYTPVVFQQNNAVVNSTPTATPVPYYYPTPYPAPTPHVSSVVNSTINTNGTNSNTSTNSITNTSNITQNGNGNVAQVNQSGVITSVSSAGSIGTPLSTYTPVVFQQNNAVVNVTPTPTPYYPTPYPTPYPTYTPYPTPYVNAQLVISKTVRNVSRGDTIERSSVGAKASDTVEFFIHVRDNGSYAAQSVNVTDFLPNGLHYVNNSTSVNGSIIQTPVVNGTVYLGTLNPGQESVIRFAAVVDQYQTYNQTLVNTAQAQSTNAGTVSAQASVVIGNVLAPALHVKTGPSDYTFILALLGALGSTGFVAWKKGLLAAKLA